MGRAAAGLLLLVPLVCGCVERRFTVVSDPPGAMLVVNRQEVGPTPIGLPTQATLFYGDYDFLLFKDGFEPLYVKQPIPAPWWQWFPLDLLTEHFWPWTLTDERTFQYQLSPAQIVPPQTLMQSAQGARGRGQTLVSEPALPPDASPPPGP